MWALPASLCALFYAFQGALAKHLLAGRGGVGLRRRVVFAIFAFAVPILCVPLMWEGIPRPAPGFWGQLLLNLALNLVAFSLYIRALEHGELSRVVPIVATTPLFMFFTSWLILGETASLLGGLGVLLVVAGILFLELRFWRGPGVWPAWLVALLWSFTANFDKALVLKSSPAAYGAVFHLLFAAAFLPLVLLGSSRTSKREVPAGPGYWRLAPLGVLQALLLLGQFYALELAPAQYVIAVKRAGVVFSVVLGIWLFREPAGRRRLSAAVLIAVGAAIILSR